ncbi:hypothetical protein MHYP_G00351650 [Metynnis hypsauchen]
MPLCRAVEVFIKTPTKITATKITCPCDHRLLEIEQHHAKACGGPSSCMPLKYLQFVLQVIVSCVTLKNICMGAGDLVQPEEEANREEEEDGQEENVTDAVRGHRLREQLCAAIADTAGTEGPGTERV